MGALLNGCCCDEEFCMYGNTITVPSKQVITKQLCSHILYDFLKSRFID